MMIVCWSFLTTLIVFIIYRKLWCFKVFKRREIPGPEPNLLFGNSLDLWVDDKHEVIRKWGKKYGKIFGFYDGTMPVLVVSDISMIEEVCRKQTSAFTGRWFCPVQPLDDGGDADNPLLNVMIAKSAHARIVRKATSAFFSTRLRQAVPDMEIKAAKIIDILAKANGQSVDSRENFQLYALETLCSIAFGIELHLLDNDHKMHKAGMHFYQRAREAVGFGVIKTPWVFRIINIFPGIQYIGSKLVHFIMKFPLGGGPLSPLHSVLQLLKDHIQQSKKSLLCLTANSSSLPQTQNKQPVRRRMNLLQMLVNASSLFKTSDQPDSGKKLEKLLTEDQLTTNVVTFALAGYETTSSTLAYASYTLATHPHVQQKLFEEISSTFSGDATESLDYDEIMNLPYLDAVCNETIRLFPEGINIINRFITEDTSLCGEQIDTAMNSVLVDMWSVHHDAELWGPVCTNQFYPERFLPDYETYNRPRAAFLGFGLANSPRQCIGKNFALLELKLTLIRLLQRFELLPPSEDAPKFLPVKVHLVMVPKDTVMLKFKERTV